MSATLQTQVRTGYKFITKEMKSQNGCSGTWKVLEWKRHDGELVICKSGFHYTKEPLDAFDYVYGDYLAAVETREDEVTEGNKTVAREMRVIKVMDAKHVAVRFAVACARRVLPNYEKKYPDDNRVRKAIEAAEAWIQEPSERNESAAGSARSAARSAAGSAEREWQNKTLRTIIEEAPALYRRIKRRKP